jgi:hypothetical protein
MTLTTYIISLINTFLGAMEKQFAWLLQALLLLEAILVVSPTNTQKSIISVFN